MMKLGLLLTVSALLVAAPSVLASSVPGSACRRTRADRQIGLRVHKLSCQAADKSVRAGTRGFKCRTFGQTRLIPYKIKCVSRKRESAYYLYEFFGG